MALHLEFQEAGVSAGLQIWRVEGTTLKCFPESLQGSFYMGDAYLVLNTVMEEGVSYSLHYWLGKKCSQNESGAAAIFTIKMDDHLGGKAVQYRELQGFESIAFTSYFKQRIIYLAGGVASVLRHAVTNDMSVQRLFHVKGRRVVRALEVPLAWASFNKEDCFILDLGEVIYQWCGSTCNRVERQKAGQVGAGIRDNERNGRAMLVLVEEGAEPLRMTEILGSKPDLPDGDGSDDAMADISNRKMAKLLMVSDMTGSIQVSVVAEENPFSQTQLLSEACFILDHGTTQIFVWKGRKANPTERKEAMKAAECYIKQMDYPANTKIQVLPEGGETSIFKQFFRDWKENEGFGTVSIIEWIAKIQQEEFDASKLHERRHMAAQYNMVDDGSGSTEVWRVENSKRVPVDPDTYGQFYGGDCYIILYTYPKGQIIYTWQGLHSTSDELAASAFLTMQLDHVLGKTAVQVTVSQGKEPAHLLSLFRPSPLIVYRNGTSRIGGQAPPPPTRLFQVRRSLLNITRIAEVEVAAASLNSNDAYLLKLAGGDGHLWVGRGSSEEEVEGAEYIRKVLDCTANRITEGAEPAEFWVALGGKAEYQTSELLKRESRPHAPRLFACSNKSGRFYVEEVLGEFTQNDLAEDEVMLLDVWDQVFVWIGKDANQLETTESVKSARRYIETDPAVRDVDTAVVIVRQGHEPPTFTGWFLAWEADAVA